MKQSFFFSILVIFTFTSPSITSEDHFIGQTKVTIESVYYNSTALKSVFVNLHENETTGIEVAKEYLQTESGQMILAKHTGSRNIRFSTDGASYVFDPNRMFTKKGIKANLKLLNKKYTAAVVTEVENFADKIIDKIKKSGIVIALHNNTNGRPLSVNSYKVKHVNASMDADDFVLTTNKKIFEQLKRKNLNAVLETASTSKDDGSLAYYCSKKNIPYINVEAEHGHSSEQLKMLAALTDIITSFSH